MSVEPRDRGAETRALVEDLSRDLEPVRRIPRLRTVCLGIIGLGGLATVWAWVGAGGLREDLFELLGQHPGFAAIALGLATMGVGGTIAAVAGSVPGRQTLERTGWVLLGLGSLVALLVGPGWILLYAAGVSLWPGPEEI